MQRLQRACIRRARWLLLASLAVAPNVTEAQVLRGIIQDAGTGLPIGDACADLIDTTGRIILSARSNAGGGYLFRIPSPGKYAVVAMHIGHVRQQSVWLTLSIRDTSVVVSRLSRAAETKLSPVTIRAQQDSLRELSLLGLAPKTLGGTIVTPAEVDAAAIRSSSIYDLLQSLHPAGIQIKYMHLEREPGVLPGWYNCIVYTRTNGCVLLIIDGVRYHNLADLVQLEQLLPPALIAYMVFLRPQEAGVLYGTGASDGVLIVITKGARK